MKRWTLLCMILAVMCTVVFAAEKGDDALPVGVSGVAVETAVMTDDYSAAKARYYELFDRIEAFTASSAELTEMWDLCQVWGLDLPPSMLPVDDGDGRLDQGSGDCTTPTVITACPYSDSGNFDGDNDCSVPSASPSNELFYTFTPPADGVYQFRARSGSGGVAAIRVLSVSCCTGGTSVAFSSSTVATDCGEPASSVTYLRAALTGGVQYWFHVGTSSATVSTAAYDFQMTCVPCPTLESATPHGTCEEAQTIACNDSLYGNGATATAPDYYRFTIGEWDSVYIFVGGREFGHCNSGFYPSNTSLASDGRYTLFNITAGCPGDSIRRVDDEGCSFDAIYGFRLAPGTYLIKVWNYNVNDYVLTLRCFPTEPPLDCNTFYPCGSPAEAEPNGLCTDANILPVADCGGNVYGTLCPGDGDTDLWYVPATAPGQILTVLVHDGADCMTFPPAGAGVRMATNTTGGCFVPTSGTFYAGFIFGGCVPWPGGWIAVQRFAGAENRYRLESTCTEYECPCPASTEPLTAQHCQSCAGEILDYTWLVSTINVPIEYRITDLNVCVDITHTFDGDIDMYLVTPWGDTLELTTDNGSSGDNFRVTTFDDEAATSITTGTAPFNGSYQPEEALTAVDGYNAIGAWQLAIYDDAGGDRGYVHCWCLNFTYDIILAVELAADFAATVGDRSVTLTWATATETNNDRFEIRRNGSLVASKPGAGTSSTRIDYAWTDSGVENGVTYAYELEAVDVNGTRTHLGTVEATPSGNAATITEYALHQNFPNPFNPATSIAFDLVESGFVSLKVYNLMGQEVASIASGSMNAGRHIVSFDAANLSSGLYLYRLDVNGFTAQKKMLLMK